jgi:hypothetical protein
MSVTDNFALNCVFYYAVQIKKKVIFQITPQRKDMYYIFIVKHVSNNTTKENKYFFSSGATAQLWPMPPHF